MHLEIASNLISYYLVTVVSFFISLAVAGIVFWRNRNRATGIVWGLASLGFGLWCLGFSQYFRALPHASEMFWAKITLTAAIINTSFYFHGMNELIGTSKKYRYPIIACYIISIAFAVMAWVGPIISEIRSWVYLEHYIKYNRAWYSWLSLHIGLWPTIAAIQQVLAIRKLTGYKRNQIVYFLIATMTIFISTTLIVVLIEYNIAIPPFCLFLLPFNMAFLAYVLAKGRLMEINLAIGRAMVYGVTIFVVGLLCIVGIGVANQIDPHFLGTSQILFITLLVLVVTSAMAVILPRLGPQAEQAFQSRFFGDRYRYQQALNDIITQISTISSAEELLQTIVDKIVEHMKVPRAAVLMQEDVTTDFVARARANLQGSNGDAPMLADNTEVIQWMRQNKRSLIKEELQFREALPRAKKIADELEKIGASMCVPMMLDGQLVGMLALENKISGDMFVERDIRLLERLCGEVALAVRYRKFENQLLQTSKLASLGTLAAGIAHEIRNPLSSIKTFVQLLPTRPNDLEFQAEFSQLVSNDVDRITKIIENVLSFARSSNVNMVEQRIEAVIEDSIELIRSKIKRKNVEIIKNYGQVPAVKVDKDQMAQVFVNILLNAVEALPEQTGKIKITCTTAMLESPLHERRRKTQHLTVEIADNGPGIPENIKGRLFDPFFTTKAEGTGLGLAITYKVVEVHGGFIVINSAEGQGAAFQVNLPL